MPKRTLNHHAWLISELKDPVTASNYLNEALGDSPKMFLEALRNVGEAWRMSIVATKAGVGRESLYKTLSKRGNPRLYTLDAVLRVLGLEIRVRPQSDNYSSTPLRAISISKGRTVGPLKTSKGKQFVESNQNIGTGSLRSIQYQNVATRFWDQIAPGPAYQHGTESVTTTGKAAPFIEMGMGASTFGGPEIHVEVNQEQQENSLLLGLADYGKQQIGFRPQL